MSVGSSQKPAPGTRFRVWLNRGKAYVLDAEGETVWGPGVQALAERKCEQLNAPLDAASKRGKRACLCCGETFLSEGIHNRMCNRCRAKASGDMGDFSYVRASSARRMKG